MSLDFSEPKRKGLRSQHNLNIPRTFKKAGDQAFSVAGPCVWNSLPIQIRNSKSTDLFKKATENLFVSIIDIVLLCYHVFHFFFFFFLFLFFT